MGIVVCVTVEAVLEGGGWIAQLAFAHNRNLLKIQLSECLVANLVGDLEPERSVSGGLPVAELCNCIFHRFTYGIEIATEGFHTPCGEISALLAYACARAW